MLLRFAGEKVWVRARGTEIPAVVRRVRWWRRSVLVEPYVAGGAALLVPMALVRHRVTPAWHSRAACRAMGEVQCLADDDDPAARARALCFACPVAASCRAEVESRAHGERLGRRHLSSSEDGLAA